MKPGGYGSALTADFGTDPDPSTRTVLAEKHGIDSLNGIDYLLFT